MLHNYIGEKVPLFTQGHAGHGGWLTDGLEGDFDTGLVWGKGKTDVGLRGSEA